MKQTKRKRKRKLKKGFKILLIILLIIALTIPTYLLATKNTKYSKEAIAVFKENKVYSEVKEKKKYSKTLDVAASQNNFDKKYLNEYLNINYIEDENFINNINSLLELGYQSEDINIFYQKIPNSINTIIYSNYDEEIINYLDLPYFIEDNLKRYIEYETDDNKLYSIYDVIEIEENYNYEDTVTFVNAYLDKEYYTNDINLTEEEANKIDVIVNKYYKLSKDYIPNDLTTINTKYAINNNQKLRKEAATKFEEMAEAASNNGFKISAGSTYRSYDYQLNLYNRYVKQDGFAEAETYSARAGYSEHQLGLAIDILNGQNDYLSENDKEYNYLINNSYKYGYILRYPRGKEYITGYVFEDWHFRYLGVELATKVYNSGLTYDEYIARNN